MNPKIEYIDSKFDYKDNKVTDLYVLSLKRTDDEERKLALKNALEELVDNDKETMLQNQTL